MGWQGSQRSIVLQELSGSNLATADKASYTMRPKNVAMIVIAVVIVRKRNLRMPALAFFNTN